MKKRAKILILFIIATFISAQTSLPFAGAEESKLFLNIEEVSSLAIKNNFDMQIYKLDASISEKELLKARAIYDTEIDASYKYDENRLKRASTISGTRATNISQEAGISKEFPTGTILEMGFTHEREASNSSFSSYPAYHESGASLSLTQPIGKNAWGLADRNDIKITKLDIENAGYTSLDKIEDELASVQKAYWNLLLANEQLDLTGELLEAAKRLHENAKKNFDIGLVEQPEFYAVAANLKERESDVLIAGRNITIAQNLVKFKLNLNRNIMVVPKDIFECEEIVNTFADVIYAALTKRRDYVSAKNEVKTRDLYIEMKKNSMWPQVDLKGTLKKNGLDDKFRTSVREIASEDYPEYTAEVIFSFPLENSTARAEYSQKELEKAQALVSLKKTECLIFVETHDAYIHAKSLYDSVKLLRQAMEFQEQKYAGEENRFNKGRSDTDRLIRYQNDYLNSRLKYLRSLYDYKAAVIDLELVMNTLLEEEL